MGTRDENHVTTIVSNFWACVEQLEFIILGANQKTRRFKQRVDIHAQFIPCVFLSILNNIVFVIIWY